MLEGYTSEGKKMIILGFFFILTWAIAGILLSLTGFEGRLHFLTIFLVFGLIILFVGSFQRNVAKGKEFTIGGIEGLIFIIVLLLFLGSLIITYYLVPDLISNPMATNFLISLGVSITLSGATIFAFYNKGRGNHIFLMNYAKTLLVLSLLSHMVWASLLRSLV